MLFEKGIFVFLFLLQQIATSTSSEEKKCLGHKKCSEPDCSKIPGFKNVGGSCYQLIYTGGTWEESRKACRKLHPKADLGTIRCEKENDGIMGLVSQDLKDKCTTFKKSFKINYGDLWFGLRGVNSKNGESWVNSVDPKYRKWARDEPNNISDAERFGILYFLDSSEYNKKNGFWNDQSATQKNCAALCEVIVETTGNECGYRPCRIGY